MILLCFSIFYAREQSILPNSGQDVLLIFVYRLLSASSGNSIYFFAYFRVLSWELHGKTALFSAYFGTFPNGSYMGPLTSFCTSVAIAKFESLWFGAFLGNPYVLTPRFGGDFQNNWGFSWDFWVSASGNCL